MGNSQSPLEQYDRQAHLVWHENRYPEAPNWPPYPASNHEAAEVIAAYTGRPADRELLVALEHLLDAGAVIKSELKEDTFTVRVHLKGQAPFFGKDTELTGALASALERVAEGLSEES